MIKGMLAFSWICSISYLYFGDWYPLDIQHPLSLFNREIAFIPSDIPAAFLKLFTQGIPELLFMVVLSLASLGAGNIPFALLQVNLQGAQRCLLAIALGLVMLGYYTFFLGLLGGYTGAGLFLSWTVLLCLSAMGGRQLFVLLKERRYAGTWLTRSSLCMVGTIAAFLFSKALWPAVNYDAVTYHLGIPKYFLLEGAISYIPYDSCSNFPFLAEMLYTLCFFVAGQKAAQFSSVLIFILTAFTLYDFSKNLIKGLPPWLPMLFFIAIPSSMMASITYGNDIHLAYYVLISLYVFLLWEEHRNISFLVLLGFFIGACLSVKYAALTYMPLLLLIGTGYVALKSQGLYFRRWIYSVAICSLSALVVFGPWLIKNYMSTGNPFYPGFYALFGGADMNRDMYDKINAMVIVSNMKQAVQGLWENPVRLLFFRPNSLGDNGLERNLGPLLLFFLPLVFLIKQLPLTVKKIFCAAVIIYVTWCFTFVSTRFLYPSVFLLVIVAAYALTETAKQSSAVFRFFINMAAVFYIFFSCIMGLYQVNMVTQTYGFNFLHESDDRYLRRHMIDDTTAILFSYPVYKYANDTLPGNALVLIIGDAQHVYINRRHRYTYLSATTPYDAFKTNPGSYHEIARSLKAGGITHIVYNPLEMSRLNQAGASLYGGKDQEYIAGFFASSCVRCLYTYRLFVGKNEGTISMDHVGLYELL